MLTGEDRLHDCIATLYGPGSRGGLTHIYTHAYNMSRWACDATGNHLDEEQGASKLTLHQARGKDFSFCAGCLINDQTVG